MRRSARDDVCERLAGTGLSDEAATRAADLFDTARTALSDRRQAAVDRPCAFLVPGRLEVLGKHTDYAGGRSLLAALERGFVVVAAPRDDDIVTVTDAIRRESAEYRLTREAPAPTASWRLYPGTVVHAIASNFPGATTGVDLALASNLPRSAGLSSSSALVVATFLAIAAVLRLDEDPLYRAHLADPAQLAEFLAAVEAGRDHGAFSGGSGVGTLGGSEDHTAILCAGAGRLVRYVFAPTRFEGDVAMPARHAFVVASSGVRADKKGGAKARYNRAADLLRTAASLWRDATGRVDANLGAALASGDDAAGRILDVVRAARVPGLPADELLARVEQFIEESDTLVPAAAHALDSGDLAAFGDLVSRSQTAGDRGLRNQVEETRWLVRAATDAGAVAASAFGAGFGGSVWALVRSPGAGAFARSWRDRYVGHFPERAGACDVFVTRAAPAAMRLV